MVPAAGLLIIYLLSFVSLAITVARLVAITQFSIDDDPFAYMETQIDDIIWIIAEMMTVIICANLPTMPALVCRIRSLVRRGGSSSPTFPHGDGSSRDTAQSPRSAFSKWTCLHMFSDSFPSFSLSVNSNSSHFHSGPASKTKLDEEKEGIARSNMLGNKDNDIEMNNNPRYLCGGFPKRPQHRTHLASWNTGAAKVERETIPMSLPTRCGLGPWVIQRTIEERYGKDEVTAEGSLA